MSIMPDLALPANARCPEWCRVDHSAPDVDSDGSVLVVHRAAAGPRVALRQLDAVRPDGQVDHQAADVVLDGEALPVGEARRLIAELALAVLVVVDGGACPA